MESYNALLARLAEIGHINTSAAVLGWDQQCYMPPGGAHERAEQLAVLGKIAHEMHTSDETRRLLEAAERETDGLDAGSDEKLTLRVVRRDFDRSTKLPTELVTEIAKATTIGHESTWWIYRARWRRPTDTRIAPTMPCWISMSRG
jgi:carboxypeptidase Taq